MATVKAVDKKAATMRKARPKKWTWRPKDVVCVQEVRDKVAYELSREGMPAEKAVVGPVLDALGRAMRVLVAGASDKQRTIIRITKDIHIRVTPRQGKGLSGAYVMLKFMKRKEDS